MRGWLILVGFYGLGAALHKWGHIPLPGSLIGMLLLALALNVGWVKLSAVEQASRFLLTHMLLFFIPIVVAVVPYVAVVRQQPWTIVLSLFLGTPLVILTAGAIVQRMGRKSGSEPAVLPGTKGRALDA